MIYHYDFTTLIYKTHAHFFMSVTYYDLLIWYLLHRNLQIVKNMSPVIENYVKITISARHYIFVVNYLI